jgi:ubiquinone/menaquinone biosynthesis C-methylase UbiE
MASTSHLLGGLDGGRVLDVGTGRGSFTRTLIDELRSYAEIVGLDVSDADATVFADAFGAMRSVEFLQADAAAMPFADESFDTVAIAGSLHHTADPGQVLMEMRRVLSPGGAFIVGEQFRDRLTRPETTHRLFHEWSEQIMAVASRRTYRRAEIIDLVNGIELEGVQQIVVRDDSDPMDSGKIARWDGLIGDFLHQVRGGADLVTRGLTIRAHLREDGILVGPALFTLGMKPASR